MGGNYNDLSQKIKSEFNIYSRTQAYIQARVLKMTLESLSMEARRDEQITEEEQVATEKELEEQTVYKSQLNSNCDNV